MKSFVMFRNRMLLFSCFVVLAFFAYSPRVSAQAQCFEVRSEILHVDIINPYLMCFTVKVQVMQSKLCDGKSWEVASTTYIRTGAGCAHSGRTDPPPAGTPLQPATGFESGAEIKSVSTGASGQPMFELDVEVKRLSDNATVGQYPYWVDIPSAYSVAGDTQPAMLELSPYQGGETDIVLHPNPVSGELRVNWSGESAECVIYDLQGKAVHKALLKGGKQGIDVSTLPNGVYVLRVGSVSKQFIKQ